MAGSAQNDEGEITAINVTPLVDIMLVLLIIFMVTATYIVKETIEIQLPKAASGGESTAKTFAIMLTKDGKLWVDGKETSEEEMLKRVKQAQVEKKDDVQVMIGADKEALHGAVVHVLDVLKLQGITKFAIEIEKEAS